MAKSLATNVEVFLRLRLRAYFLVDVIASIVTKFGAFERFRPRDNFVLNVVFSSRRAQMVLDFLGTCPRDNLSWVRDNLN